MLIDCHTHIGDNQHIRSSVHDLLMSMDKSYIDKSLVFAGKLNNIDNTQMLAAIAPHKKRLYGVAAYHPEDDTLDEVILKDAILNKSVVAVKFYLGYDHWYPNDFRIQSILSLMEDHNITAIFHCGDCLNSVKKAKLKYAHPLGVDDPAVDHPNLKIVIAHMGFPWHRDTAEVCYKNANVYTDISGFVYNNFDEHSLKQFSKTVTEFLDIAPSKKLLFGTDFPISSQTSYREAVDILNMNGVLNSAALFENVNKAFNL